MKPTANNSGNARFGSLRVLSLVLLMSNAVSGLAEQDADPAKTNVLKLARELEKLRYDALLPNPLLDFDEMLVLKRKRGQLGLPVNHKCNSGIDRTGYDNEIAVLSPVRTGRCGLCIVRRQPNLSAKWIWTLTPGSCSLQCPKARPGRSSRSEPTAPACAR